MIEMAQATAKPESNGTPAEQEFDGLQIPASMIYGSYKLQDIGKTNRGLGRYERSTSNGKAILYVPTDAVSKIEGDPDRDSEGDVRIVVFRA